MASITDILHDVVSRLTYEVKALEPIVDRKEDIDIAAFTIMDTECTFTSYVKYDDSGCVKWHHLHCPEGIDPNWVIAYHEAHIAEDYGEHHCYHCDQGWDCCGRWIFCTPKYEYVREMNLVIARQAGYQNV